LRKVEEMHKGIDLAAPHGTSVLCAEGGTVRIATEKYVAAPTAGTVVVVDHGGGQQTFYSHLSSLSVKVGQKVTRGQVVGRVGNTGVSTGPHLHFEVWEGETHVDPATVIPALATRQ
jgi:murein DD-endopeptidase MepM/ murein hydrolase activator NlpD